MTKINMKKVTKYALLFYAAVVCLFTIGAFGSLTAHTFCHINFIFIFLAAAILFGAVILLYLKHLEKCAESGRKSPGLSLLETFHRYRFLIEQLVSRDFKIKYKRSVLGVFWSFLNPLLMMIVQYVVFSKLLGIRGNVEHYAIYLLCGIVIWNGFNDCSTQALRSITGSAQLITKVYVPKYIYPVTKVLSASINVLLSMIPLLLVSIIYGLFSTPHLYLTNAIVLLPFGLIFLLIFCLGMGFLLSSLMVFFRDIEFLWGVISTIWMYATPIIYSLSMFEGKEGAEWLIRLMQFNPLYHLVSFIRTIVLEGCSPAFREYLICAGFAAVMFAFGYFVFRKTEDKFILYI